MEASSCRAISLLFLLSLFSYPSICQQDYVGNDTSCSINNSWELKRYSCNGRDISCISYLTSRSAGYYNYHLSSYISFGDGKLLITPTYCSCLTSSSQFQYITYYIIQNGDTYEKVVKYFYEGLTSCSMLRVQNNDYAIDSKSAIGTILNVPLRCACPTPPQISSGVHTLVVYTLQPTDTIGYVARNFGVEEESVLEANNLTKSSSIYPFTPVLIPVNKTMACKMNPSSNLNDCFDRSSPPRKLHYTTQQVVLIAIGFVIVSLISFFCGCKGQQLLIKKRKDKLYKNKFFKKNGGLKLEQKLVEDREKVRLFSQKELEQATDNYNESRFLGQGGYGKVYKGMLNDNTIVAIKKSMKIEANSIEQFINEVIILSQVNHKNIVKLLGCCLETKFPLLVYEFVSNGTLTHHIHKQDRRKSYFLSWKTRLRIASEVAGAISYMHSAASIPIFHRDIKSSNILLDDNYSAKVSDFGTSRFVSCDQSHLTTKVLGTFGYIDPEYFRTSQYTEKSDVYSFGVLMVELLTGNTPFTFAENDGRNLLDNFISLEKANRLVEILDVTVANEESMEVVNNVATIATRCLRSKGKERPTMKQVYLELEGLRKSQNCSEIIERMESVGTSSLFPDLWVEEDVELTDESTFIEIETRTT